MVEWKKLGEVCCIKTGKGITQENCSENYPYPVISGGQTPMGYYNEFNRDGHTVTISRVGAYAGYASYITEKFYLNDKCFSIIPYNQNIGSKLLYYCLKNKEEEIKLLQSEGGVPTINTQKLGRILIPIPPLSEQQRIVGILDTFTASIDNLKEQIAQRRKQYEYYRDQLLDLEGKPGVEMKTLGEIGEFVRGPFGGALKKDIFVKEGYAIYEQQHAIYGKWTFRYFIDKKKFSEMKRFEVTSGDILMSCSGTMGKTSIVPDNCVKGIINQALLKLTIKSFTDNKYVKTYMDSQWFQERLKMQTAGGAIQNVASVSILKNLIIPVPSLAEQQRIVGILDTFEASIANLESQLKEREKQYEYYRNKLLTFE